LPFPVHDHDDAYISPIVQPSQQAEQHTESTEDRQHTELHTESTEDRQHTDQSSVINTKSVQPSIPAFPPRRSTRSHRTPSHLQDFICSNIQVSWCNLTLVPPAHMASLTALEEFPEPVNYEQATKHPGWVEAMQK